MPLLTHLRMAGIICAITMLTSSLAAFPTPVDAAFSYLGVIKAGGSPLTGTMDFQFSW